MQKMTIREMIDFVDAELKQHPELFYGHGTENAWDEAVALVLQVLNVPFSVSDEELARILSNDEVSLLTELLDQRIQKKVPLGYLTKEAFFCGLPFYVDERVLIPRSPIAELIENQFQPWIEYDQVHRVLDMCTGGGCIAIACAYAFEMAGVDAVDIDPNALAVAKINVEKHQVENQVRLIQSDLFESIPEKKYDIIVSNPPYVSFTEMQNLPQEYLHEPRHALEADDNGLFLVEKILRTANHYLSDHGILIVEVGNSEQALIEHYPKAPFIWLSFEHGGHGVFLITKKDLQDLFTDAS